MATTSQEYTLERKTGADTSEEIQIPASSVSGLANVATSGSYNDLSNKPTIPSAVTSIDGLGGGTLTSPIELTGGDGAAASKMILTSNGQITDTSTSTLFGFSSGNLIVGHGSYPLTMRGKQPRPTWNGKDLALKPDIPDVSGKQDKLTAGSNITISGNTISATVPTKTSQLTNDSNFVKSNSGTFTGNLTADNFNSRFSLQSVPYGTAVGENADLNTVTYLSVGNYYCGADAIVSTMTNVPVKRAFMMTVYSPLTPTVDNETTGKWVYRVRKFMTYLGEEYIQSVYSGNTAGTFTYGAWQQIAHKSDIPSVPTFSLSGTTLTITL